MHRNRLLAVAVSLIFCLLAGCADAGESTPSTASEIDPPATATEITADPSEPEQPVAYRLLVNDPQGYARCRLTARAAGNAEMLAVWRNEWRAAVLDESMTSTLYLSEQSGGEREGSAEDIRFLLDSIADSVADVYAGDVYSDDNPDPIVQAAAESASGAVLWSFSYNGRYALVAVGDTGYCFQPNEDVCRAIAERFGGESGR